MTGADGPRRRGSLVLAGPAGPQTSGRPCGPELLLVRRGTVVLGLDDRVHRLQAADAVWLFPESAVRLGGTGAEASWWSLRIEAGLLEAVGVPADTDLRRRRPPAGHRVTHLPPAYFGWFEARLNELQHLGDPVLFNAALVHAALASWDACRPDLRHLDRGSLVAAACAGWTPTRLAGPSLRWRGHWASAPATSPARSAGRPGRPCSSTGSCVRSRRSSTPGTAAAAAR